MYNIAPDKVFSVFQPKSTNMFFSYFSTKNMLWYSLEAPRRGASNDYSQHIFLCRNKKNIMRIPVRFGAVANTKKKHLVLVKACLNSGVVLSLSGLNSGILLQFDVHY